MLSAGETRHTLFPCWIAGLAPAGCESFDALTGEEIYCAVNHSFDQLPLSSQFSYPLVRNWTNFRQDKQD